MTVAPLPQPTRADPGREYVAGGSWPYAGFAQAARALPHPIDDITRELRVDLYEQMEVDSHVQAVTTIFRASIVGDGLEIVPAIDDDTDDNVVLARQIADECDEMVHALATPINELLYGYTRAMGVGNIVGELLWDLRNTPNGQRLVVTNIKIKPRQATCYVVDPYMNVLGLLAVIPGEPWSTLVVLPDVDRQTNLLPRAKFACYAWHPKEHDPRGTSVLRGAYSPWWSKTQLNAEYLKYLSQFGSPSIVGTLAENARDETVVDASGAVVNDANGFPQVKTAAQAMADSITVLRNGTYIVVPFGATVHPLITTGNGQAFEIAFRQYNRDIVLAVLTQLLATGEGEHASRAQAGIHQDALQTIVKQAKQGLCGMVERDILQQFVLLNYGKAALPLTPHASLGDAAETDYAPIWTALAALAGAGYLDDTQKPPLDVQVGLPQRQMVTGQPPQTNQPPSPPPPPQQEQGA